MRQTRFFLATAGHMMRFAGRARIGSRARLGGADMGPVNMQHRMRDARARWWSQLMDKFRHFSPAHCTDRRTFRTQCPCHFRTRKAFDARFCGEHGDSPSPCSPCEGASGASLQREREGHWIKIARAHEKGKSELPVVPPSTGLVLA